MWFIEYITLCPICLLCRDMCCPHFRMWYVPESVDVWLFVPNSRMTVSVSPIWQSQWVVHNWDWSWFVRLVDYVYSLFSWCILNFSSCIIFIALCISFGISCMLIIISCILFGGSVHGIVCMRGSSLRDNESVVQELYDCIYGTSFFLHSSSSHHI